MEKCWFSIFSTSFCNVLKCAIKYGKSRVNVECNDSFWAFNNAKLSSKKFCKNVLDNAAGVESLIIELSVGFKSEISCLIS